MSVKEYETTIKGGKKYLMNPYYAKCNLYYFRLLIR